MTEPVSGAPRPDAPADSALPAGNKPVARQIADGEPAPESERQTAETIRSISRLEESN
ncbi:MAG: hypothetical protein ACR2K2_01770 [Mycobacteriales bacterium]